MATKKAKRTSAGVKKSSHLKKGSALEAVKPLKETVSLTFGKVAVTYTQQAPDSLAGVDTLAKTPPPK